MTILFRLNYNFDTTKFGDAVDPDGNLVTNLKKQSPIISANTATRYQAILAGNTATATYFQNPLADTLSNLNTVVASLYSTIWNYSVNVNDSNGYLTQTFILQPVADVTFPTLVTNLQQELTTNDSNPDGSPKSFNTFISHTNRLSNLASSNKANRPSFTTAPAVCRTVQSLVYQTETQPIDKIGGIGLGAFTSLFIGSDLTTYFNNFTSYSSTLATLLSTNPTSVTDALRNVINKVNIDITNLLLLLQTRRTHDQDFYVNATAIINDLNKIQGHVAMAAAPTNSTQSIDGYLVKNLIGKTAINNL